jgi:hypothetical protein
MNLKTVVEIWSLQASSDDEWLSNLRHNDFTLLLISILTVHNGKHSIRQKSLFSKTIHILRK